MATADRLREIEDGIRTQARVITSGVQVQPCSRLIIHGNVRNPTSPTNPLVVEASHKHGCPLDPGKDRMLIGGLHYMSKGV